MSAARQLPVGPLLTDREFREFIALQELARAMGMGLDVRRADDPVHPFHVTRRGFVEPIYLAGDLAAVRDWLTD
jgi:hypothetical protein